MSDLSWIVNEYGFLGLCGPYVDTYMTFTTHTIDNS